MSSLSREDIEAMEKAARETLEYLKPSSYDPAGCHEVIALCEHIRVLREKNLLLAAAVRWFDGYMDGDMRPTVVILGRDQTNTRAVAEAEEIIRELKADAWDEGWGGGWSRNPYRDHSDEEIDDE